MSPAPRHQHLTPERAEHPEDRWIGCRQAKQRGRANDQTRLLDPFEREQEGITVPGAQRGNGDLTQLVSVGLRQLRDIRLDR